MKDAERWKKGAAKMKELFGREPQPGMMHEGFLEVTVENLFGDIWNRPGLELKERSMITVAATKISVIVSALRRLASVTNRLKFPRPMKRQGRPGRTANRLM